MGKSEVVSEAQENINSNILLKEENSLATWKEKVFDSFKGLVHEATHTQTGNV